MSGWIVQAKAKLRFQVELCDFRICFALNINVNSFQRGQYTLFEYTLGLGAYDAYVR